MNRTSIVATTVVLILLILVSVKYLQLQSEAREVDKKLSQIRSDLYIGMPLNEVEQYLRGSSIKYQKRLKEGNAWSDREDIDAEFFMQITFGVVGEDQMLGLVSQTIVITIRLNEKQNITEVVFKRIFGFL